MTQGDWSLVDSLATYFEKNPWSEVDEAAVRLALHYAQELDNGGDLAKLGPAYLAALESLGMTPRARAAITGKAATGSDSGPRPLDQLRARRAARAHGTPPVDEATP